VSALELGAALFESSSPVRLGMEGETRELIQTMRKEDIERSEVGSTENTVK
jgi:hypothetical protein